MSLNPARGQEPSDPSLLPLCAVQNGWSKMLNYSRKPYSRRSPASARRSVLTTALVLTLVLLSQSGCFFLKKKAKPEAVAVVPVRMIILPFNVPSGDKDLRWLSMAAPILMAKTGENAKGLEIIPIWQTMPTAINVAGSSRTFTEESAATVANWMTAKWVVLGELNATKNGISMTVDFVPARVSLVPFRFLRTGKLDVVGEGFYEAYIQFLRYLVSRPFVQPQDKGMTMTSVKDLAEALDREYGWSVEADPGKAQQAVSSLLSSDEKLARMLFSPTLYPSLAGNEKK
jgi:hypothetical protein